MICGVSQRENVCAWWPSSIFCCGTMPKLSPLSNNFNQIAFHTFWCKWKIHPHAYIDGVCLYVARKQNQKICIFCMRTLSYPKFHLSYRYNLIVSKTDRTNVNVDFISSGIGLWKTFKTLGKFVNEINDKYSLFWSQFVVFVKWITSLCI